MGLEYMPIKPDPPGTIPGLIGIHGSPTSRVWDTKNSQVRHQLGRFGKIYDID